MSHIQEPDYGPPPELQQAVDPEPVAPISGDQAGYGDGPPPELQQPLDDEVAPNPGDQGGFGDDPPPVMEQAGEFFNLDGQGGYDAPPPGLEQVEELFNLDDLGDYGDGNANVDDQSIGSVWDDQEQTAVESFFETFTPATDLYRYSQQRSGRPLQGVILAYRGNNTGKSVIVGYDWNGKKTARVEAAARRAIPPEALNIRANSIGHIRHYTKANISAWGLIAWRVEPEYQDDPTSVLRPMKGAWYPETYARIMWDTGEITFESRHTLRYIHADDHLKTDMLIYNIAISQEGHYQEALTGRMPVYPSWDEPIQNLHWRNTNAYGGAHWLQKRAERTRRVTNIVAEPVTEDHVFPEYDSGIETMEAYSREDQLHDGDNSFSDIVEEVDGGYYSEGNREDNGRDEHQHGPPAGNLSPILEENFVTPGGVYTDSSNLWVTPHQYQSQPRSHRRINGMLTPESSTPSISRRAMGNNQYTTSGHNDRPAQENPSYNSHAQRPSQQSASSINRRETQPRISPQGGQAQRTPLPQGSQGQASQRASPAQGSQGQASQRTSPAQRGQGQASQRTSPAQGNQQAQRTPLPQGSQGQASQRTSPAQRGQGQASQRTSPAQGSQGQASQRTSPAQRGQGQASQRTSPAQGGQAQTSQRASPAQGGQAQRTPLPQGSQGQTQRTSPAQGGQQPQLRTPLPQDSQGQAQRRGRGQGGGRGRSGGPAQDYQGQEQDTPTPRNNTQRPRRWRGQGGGRGQSNGASNTPVQQNGASDVPVRRSTRYAPRRHMY